MTKFKISYYKPIAARDDVDYEEMTEEFETEREAIDFIKACQEDEDKREAWADNYEGDLEDK